MDKFSDFNILSGLTYKEIDAQPILVDVLLPKQLKPAKSQPVLINWHGGGLVTGHRAFEMFWAPWLLSWAKRAQAIIVAADYRLAPESPATEILTDLESLWTWVHGDLPRVLASRTPGIAPDLSRIALCGDSAGGWCAIQQALAHPNEISAVVLRFPMLDLESDFFIKGTGGQPIGHFPLVSSETIDNHLASMVPGRIVTVGEHDRLPLTFSAFAHGRLLDFLGRTDQTFPLRKIRTGAQLPKRIWILHGSDDSAVPYDGSMRVVDTIRAHCKGTDIELDTAPGDHGFDGEWSIDHDVITSRLQWIDEAWLGMK